MVKASQILSIPIYATTQNAARLGPLCSELNLSTQPPSSTNPSSSNPTAVHHLDKTLFSMALPPLLSTLPPSSSIALLGIEAHICVTQTALDLLARGHKVYVLADGVSSCNREEVGIALRRLAVEGCVVTSSEGWLFEVLGDAGREE
ncbi:MAG: hypothetical protein M1836_001027 [Candelina mexicana]|nr:MAG: hypothetical protein M1836_001027 [Candelina mexicana]